MHLVYFVIKNHPFADGNKRSGAFVINDIGLAALAPDQKDTLIRLIMTMLSHPPVQGCFISHRTATPAGRSASNGPPHRTAR